MAAVHIMFVCVVDLHRLSCNVLLARRLINAFMAFGSRAPWWGGLHQGGAVSTAPANTELARHTARNVGLSEAAPMLISCRRMELVAQAYGGRLATPSQKSWNVELPDGTTLQVKCRVIDPGAKRTQVYSPLRGWDFDCCVFVLLDINSYDVISGVEVPATSLRSVARRSEWVAGDRISLSTGLASLDGARDVTELLAAAMAVLE